MTEILQLINNLDVVDLLSPSSINLISYESSYPGKRDTVHASVYGDGTSLISSQFENIIETFTLSIVGASQDDAIINLRNLTSILEAGKAYYTGFRSTPTYIIAKTKDEIGTRFAILKNYKMDKLPQVLGATPFGSSGLLVNGQHYPSGFFQVTVVIEIDFWRNRLPGTYRTLGARTYEIFNETYHGTTNFDGSSISQESTVYVGNRYTIANLSHIYRYNSDLATFSSNLINQATPFNLFAVGIDVGDILYFGCQTTIPNSGPFFAIVINVGTPADSQMTIVWEVSAGGGSWVSVSVQGNGIHFTESGSTVIGFNGSGSWATDTVNGVASTLWLRARITAMNGNTTIPTSTEKIYAVTWPYIEIQSSEVSGDITVLARYLIKTITNDFGTAGKILRIVMGLRSVSRGSDFMSIWNASDEQNPPGVTFGTSFGVGISNNMNYPTGRIVDTFTISDSDVAFAYWTVSSEYAGNYIGRFRVFLQFVVSSSTGSPTADEISFFLRVKPPDVPFVSLGSQSSPYFQTEYKSPDRITTNVRFTVDLGEISISDSLVGETIDNDLYIYAIGICPDGKTVTMRFVQLELIPVDEWSCEVVSRPATGILDPAPVTATGFETGEPEEGRSYLELDGTKAKNMALTRNVPTDGVAAIPIYNSVTVPILQKNATQRVFFSCSGEDNRAVHSITLKVNPYGVYRYLALRGSE